MNVLLSGIVGSTAYGLNHENSDVERLGVFAAPTRQFHGLSRPQESIVETDPDVTMHEVRKWCRLALNGNPTVMELVWLPKELYETVTPLGQELIDIRSAFLSASRVRNAYLGYATQQFSKMESDQRHLLDDAVYRRTAKHARHMYRLLIQGLGLWTTGELLIEVSNGDVVHSFGAQVAMGHLSYARKILTEYEAAFDNSPTVLPSQPDQDVVEAWLHRVRDAHYKR